MEFTQILLDVDDHIATITLNRPDRLNAFTNVMMDELIAAFDLTGAGPSPCKFGDRCRFFARGCCRNYHPQVPIEPLGEHNWYY